MLLISWTVLLNCSGCARTSVYVLDQQELVKVKSGDTITAKFDGYLMSNRAITRAMGARVDDIKRD